MPEGSRYEDDRRMVLNLRYRPAPASYETIREKIVFEMVDNEFSEVIYIDPGGEVHYFAA